MKRIITPLFCIFGLLLSFSPKSFGQLVPSYGFNAFSAPFVSIAGTGTAAVNNSFSDDDGNYDPVPIGFNFSYNGQNYSMISVGTNGWATLDQTANGDRFNDLDNLTFNDDDPRPILAPMWSDLYTDNDNVTYQTTGALGSQVFTIEWTGSDWFEDYADNGFNFGTPILDFQIVLYEGTNIIEFRYNVVGSYDGAADGVTESIGITGGNGASVGGQVEFLSLSDESASPSTSSLTETDNLSAQPASNQVYQFIPPLPCNSQPTAGTIVAGTATSCLPITTTLTLTGNTVATGLTYQWQSSTDNVTFVPIAGANNNSYTTTVSTDSFFKCTVTCSTTSQSDVTPSTELSVTGPTILASVTGGGACPGVPITLNGATNAPTYSWTGPGGYSAPMVLNPTLTPGASGIYTFTATNPTCTFTRTVSVTVLPGPSPFTASPAAATICGGGSVNITASSIGPLTAMSLIDNLVSPQGTWVVAHTGNNNPANQNWTVNASGTPSSSVTIYGNITTPPGSPAFYVGADNSDIFAATKCTLTSAPFSLAGYSTASLTYNYQYPGDFSDDNFVTVLLSTDGGLTFPNTLADYTNNWTNDGEGGDSPWVPENIDLSAYIGQTNLAIRFRYASASFSWSAWYLNDIECGGLHTSGVVWSPLTSLYTDAGLTTPYTGTVGTSVYAAPTVTTTYTATASIGTCTQTSTTDVSIGPSAVATIAGTTSVCSGTSADIIFTGAPGTVVTYDIDGGAPLTITLDGTGNFDLNTGALTTGPIASTTYTYNLESGQNGVCNATLTGNAAITVNPAPLATITAFSNTDICVGGNVQFVANTGAGYSFQWLRADTILAGETNSFYTADTAGDYKVIVFYGGGCLDTSDATTVNVVQAPVATITPTGPFVFCDGGSVLLDGTTAGSTFYQWLRDGQNVLLANSATYTATATGGYEVIAVNSTGCSDTSAITVSVTVNPLPNAVISGPASVCSGSSGTVTITGTPLSIISLTVDGTAVPDVTLDNLGTATISTLTLTVSTTITLTNALDGVTGCSQAIIGQSLTINVDPLPTVALTGTATLCAGDNTNITFTGTPGAIVAYTVNGIPAVPDLTIDPSGISVVNTGALAATAAYLVTNVTDGSTGCSQVIPTSVTITVNQLPTASFNSNVAVVCSGSDALLTFIGTPNAVVSYTANGVAATDVTLSGTGTNTISTGPLTVFTTFALTQVALAGVPSCPVVLSASLDVDINPLPTATIAGTTTICSGDNAVITFIGTPNATVDFTINGTGMASVLIDGTGNGSYNTGALTVNTTYDVTTVTDGTTGCILNVTGQSVLVSVNPLPVVVISPNVVICNGDNTDVIFTGTPGAIVSYTVNGVPAADVMLDITTGIWTENDGALIDTTTYTITNISDPATGCSQAINSQSEIVMVNPLPTATVSAAAATLCSGDNTVLTFTGTPNTSVTYTVNSNPVPDIALDATGTATINTGALAGPSVSIDLVSVSFNNGGPLCTQLVSGNATITVNPLPTIINITPATATLCHGDSLDMTANGTPNATFTYTQNGVAFPGQQLDASFGTVTFNSHGLLTNTTVAITSVTDPTTGCAQAVSGQTVVIAVNPLPFVSITAGGPATFCNGNSVNLTCNNTSGTYQWYRDGVAQGGATNQSFIATQSGIYNVDFTSGCHDSAATGVTVIVNPLPTATVTPGGPSSFCQGSSLTLMATVTTGFSYQWHNGVTTPVGATDANYTVFAAGTYYATITDSNGCSSSSNSNTVTINPTPVVTVTWVGGPSATTFCQGGLLVLSSSPVPSTGNHAWFRDGVALGLFTNAITANASGVYVDSFTTSSGCSALSNPVAITVNPAPPTAVTTIGTTSICPGGSAIFVANNVTPSYTFQWNINGAAIPGATDSVYIADSAASYTVQISNGFPCSALSTAINVTVNTPVATISASGPATFCDGGFVNFNANIGSSFQWFLDGNAIPGEVNTSYLAMTSGNYQVEVTNANGCPALSLPTVVTVNPTPDATITPTGPLVLCQGDTAGLSIPADATAAYQWYNGAGAIAGATNSAYGAATADAFFVLATNGFGCTAASPAVSIAVNPIPVSVILPPTATVLCSGSVTTLQSQTAVLTDTYQWQINGTDIPGATDPAYDASTSGMYTLVVTNASGCPITSAGMQINVLSFPTVMTNDPTTFCYGGSATLTVDAASIVPGLAYQWQRNGTSISGATNPIYVVTDGGLYTVIVSIPTVCSVFSSYLIMTVNPLPVPGIVNNGGTLSTEAYVSYQWYENNQPIPGAQSQSLVPASNGIYYVAATDSQGCTGVSNALDLIDLDVNNINSIRDAVKIYPNPATAMVHIESPIKVNATITAIDGKVVIRKDEAKDIDISALADGVYVITLSDVNGQQIKMEKLVKAGN